ncbi:MAG TPA: acyl-CoA dehydrogenase [Thermoanaerobaculia bacterium]|nr:acyl-CoA dehydrogenase [Thermoanaerobaculia bacterium]
MTSWLLAQARRRGLVPRISDTERQALTAGTVWLDGAFFAGRPGFRRLLAEPWPELAPAERAFLDGPVEEVCALVDEWEVQQTRRLPEAVWELLRERRFFGLGIPEEHGGLGFSALAASAIFGKLATRSPTLSAVVLIPNSVGPGELLLHYGTQEQQQTLLPRLARGDEIPCFALTESQAGSDAAALSSRGEVYPGEDGTPWLRLDFDKRYITLAPVATLVGLAFRLRDPEELLGKGPEPGITCALVPAATPGVRIGRFHDPLGIPFPNGPLSGRDVRVPASAIIGGPRRAGDGWRMLMEALSGGRGISLPAQSAAGAKHVARVAGAYAAVRHQFGTPIGRIEGVEARLARIAALTYLMEATRVLVCGGIDRGARPAVVSAVAKLATTELAREVVSDGMDVMAGAAICRGPRNLMAQAWTGLPIGVTVEGANILTRTLIVFGQGMVRSHPHVLPALAAVERGDATGLRRALFGFTGHLLGNGVRAAVAGLTRGWSAGSPVSGPTARYFRRLGWAAARFAFWADVAFLALGSRLKNRGRLSGRFADLLTWQLLAFATLRRWEAEGRRAADLPLVAWAVEHALHRIQEAFEGILANLPLPGLSWLLRGPGLAWARLNPMGRPPGDHLDPPAASVVLLPGEARERLVAGTFVPAGEEETLARLECAFRLAAEAAPLLASVREASRAGTLPRERPEALVDAALEAGVLAAAEAALVRQALAAQEEVIQVDDFSRQEYLGEASAATGGGLAAAASQDPVAS